ncbi:MAG: hypothetical protein IT203_02380 [Fimbriimonadaceae bacterium]|nr:hypothetical protein [Fimbriimonadaceae bacterium]
MLATVFAFAENEIVEAKVLEITEKGFVLQVGTEPLAVDDEHDSRFWRGKAVAKRSDFQSGDRVFARIKTDNDPPVLRELADKETWNWLDGIRKRPQAGTVEKIDSKTLTVKFADGTRFAYRATDKSKVSLKGKPEASLGDLPVGMAVFLKGRTLPTYDTWLVEVSDEPIPLPASQSKEPKEKKAKVPREPVLPESGKMTGHTLANLDKLSMFDVITTNNRALHISYTRQTKFYFEGRPCGPEAIERGLQFVLLYMRDRFGRIQATKVELYMRR